MIGIKNNEIRPYFESLVDGERNLINLNPEDVERAAYVIASRDLLGNINGIAGICIQRYIPFPFLFVLIKKSSWNNGIVTKLVKETVIYAINKYHFLTLSTLRDDYHSNAIHIYKKCGFVHIPTPDRHYWMINVRVNRYVKDTSE
jgi:RimJ/RimL family protein N-acetyltransferase